MAIKNLGKVVPEKGVDYFTDEDIRSLNIPKNTSDLTNDSGYITDYTETDPTVPSHVKSISQSDISKWDSKADASAIPTKISQLTNDKNYLTSIPSEYITETELNNKGYLTSVPSTYKTKTENDALYQPKGNYLTSVPSEYITETELNNKGYLTEHQDISDLARKDELHSHNNKSVLDNITQTNVNDWNNKSNFSGSYNDLTNKPTIPTKVSQLTNDSSYVSESYVTNAIANAQLSGDGNEIDLSGYATKDDLTNKVDKVTGKSLIADSEIERLASVTNYNDTEIKNTLATKANTSDIPTKVSQLTNDKNYLTSIPDTYKTKTENDALYQPKGNYLTSIPSEYVTDTELNAKGYLTEHQDLTEYAKTTAIPTKVSQLTNDKNYLTSVPSEYITETELNNKGYLTSVPSTYKTKTENDALYQPKGNYLTGYTETDPTVPSHVKNITTTDISNWNSKSTFSGSYNDLSNKPTIPTKVSQLTNDSGFMTELTDENITEIAKEVVLVSKWNNLGTTPFTTTETNNYRLKADGEATYTTKSDTVAVIDENTVWTKLSRCTASHDKGYWEIKPTADAGTSIYNCYAQTVVSGLVVGQQYKLIIDGRNLTCDLTNGTPWLGYAQLVDSSSNVYAKYDAKYTTPNPRYDQITFTATEETTIIRVQLATTKFTLANVIVNFHKIYINHIDGGNEATQIANTTGTFTDSVVLEQLEAGIDITATPNCKVYSEIPETEVYIPKSRHEGKTCVCFGDSIVGNMAEPNDYPTVLSELTGMTVINAGFGGCRMSDTMTNVYKAYSMVKIANAITTGDWTEQDAGLSEITIKHYAPHIETLKNINWNKVDFITIGYGTNDIANFVAVDNEGEGEEYNPLDTSTVLGSLRYSLTTLLTAYPHLKVLILTPIYRYFNDEGVDSDEKEWYNNRVFTTWTDGILDVAKEFRVPGVDMYRTLGFNKITRSYYYPSDDGTHPNHLGLKVIAGKIAGKLLSEY